MNDGILPWVALTAGSTVAVVMGWYLAKAKPKAAPGCALGLLSLIVVKAALHWLPAWEAALFPWPWYIYLQGHWLILIGAAFFGLAAAQLALPWNRAVVLAVAFGLAGYGAQRSAWMLMLQPIGLPVSADADHHLHQSTAFTCAPTACVIALSYVGIVATEQEMARLCLTRTDEGTTIFNVYRGLRGCEETPPSTRPGVSS